MSSVTRVEVKENAEELAQLLQVQTNAKLKERLQVLYLLKLPQPMTISAIARVIGKHRGTIQRWLATYQAQGIDGVLEVKKSSGRPTVIPAWAVMSLKRRLEQSEGFKSYTQVQQWLCETLGIEAEYRTVHELVRYRLKAKLKAARPVHTQQDTSALDAFKKTSLQT